MTFFTKYGSTSYDKKCCSEHQTLFPLFGGGSGNETTIYIGWSHWGVTGETAL